MYITQNIQPPCVSKESGYIGTCMLQVLFRIRYSKTVIKYALFIHRGMSFMSSKFQFGVLCCGWHKNGRLQTRLYAIHNIIYRMCFMYVNIYIHVIYIYLYVYTCVCTHTPIPTGYVKAFFIVLRGIQIRSHDHCEESDLRVHSICIESEQKYLFSLLSRHRRPKDSAVRE